MTNCIKLFRLPLYKTYRGFFLVRCIKITSEPKPLPQFQNSFVWRSGKYLVVQTTDKKLLSYLHRPPWHQWAFTSGPKGCQGGSFCVPAAEVTDTMLERLGDVVLTPAKQPSKLSSFKGATPPVEDNTVPASQKAVRSKNGTKGPKQLTLGV